MRILLTGGGTAGHINPAIAIAEVLREYDKKSEILFVGRVGGNENRLVKNSGLKLRTLHIRGIERKLTVENIKSLFLAIKSVSSAKRIIKDFNPDIIIGTGGYVSFPCLRGGIALKIPTVIHESNVLPGLVTRILAKKCSCVLVNMEGTKKYLSEKARVEVVGNPLRRGFNEMSRDEARRKLGLKKSDFFIVSFGGSIGAEKLNSTVIEVMKGYCARIPAVKHIHAAGARYYDALEMSEPELCRGINGCRLVGYIDNMPTLLRAADLVISRCGAMTLSEIAAVGRAAILIPSPNVADNHQYKNAKYLEERGAGIMIEERLLDAKALQSKIHSLRTDSEMRKSIAQRIKDFGKDNSTELILNVILDLTSKGLHRE